MPANEAATIGIGIRNNVFCGGDGLLYWDGACLGSATSSTAIIWPAGTAR